MSKKQKFDHKPFEIVTKLLDTNTQIVSIPNSRFFYSNYIFYDESIDIFIKKIKFTINKLRYTIYEDNDKTYFHILSFNIPKYSSFMIKVIKFDELTQNIINTPNEILKKYKDKSSDDTVSNDSISNILTSGNLTLNKYIYYIEFFDGCKNYTYNIFRWININLISKDINIIRFHYPQYINIVYQINDTNMIVLLDRFLSNNEIYIKKAIHDISYLINDKLSISKLIKHYSINMFIDFILDKYEDFDNNWTDIINVSISIHFILHNIIISSYKDFYINKNEYEDKFKSILSININNDLNINLKLFYIIFESMYKKLVEFN
jgi:hypothetical protein